MAIKNETSLKQIWSFAPHNEITDYGIESITLSRVSSNCLIPLAQIRSLSKEDLYVGWDSWKIEKEYQNKLLCSDEFGPCIAFLARGFSIESPSSPLCVGLAHIFRDPETIKPLLSAINQETHEGRIEVFITGGYRDKEHEKNYNKLIMIIEGLRQKMNLTVMDDQFGVMSPDKIYLVNRKKIAYSGSAGLKLAGFDEQGNPFAILGVNFNAFEGCKKDIAHFITLKKDDTCVYFYPPFRVVRIWLAFVLQMHLIHRLKKCAEALKEKTQAVRPGF